eukprot:1820838-Amphidinium_carterae.1
MSDVFQELVCVIHTRPHPKIRNASKALLLSLHRHTLCTKCPPAGVEKVRHVATTTQGDSTFILTALHISLASYPLHAPG